MNILELDPDVYLEAIENIQGVNDKFHIFCCGAIGCACYDLHDLRYNHWFTKAHKEYFNIFKPTEEDWITTWTRNGGGWWPADQKEPRLIALWMTYWMLLDEQEQARLSVSNPVHKVNPTIDSNPNNEVVNPVVGDINHPTKDDETNPNKAIIL